jgi:uncharacterized alkaline shock family protein YloU
MNTTMDTPGRTTVSPDVLISIGRLAALSVPGVSRLASGVRDINRLFSKPEDEGVLVEVEDNRVYMDLFVILNRDLNIREVARKIQSQVERSISEMVGMEVGRIDIHVEDIDFESKKA